MSATVYGSDTSTAGGVYRPGVIASEVQAVAEALERRWTCPRGRLLGCPDYGLAVNTYLCAEFTDESAARIAGDMVSEGEKDDRVQSIAADPSIVGTGASLAISIALVVTLRSGETFTLTGLVGNMTVAILGVKDLVTS